MFPLHCPRCGKLITYLSDDSSGRFEYKCHRCKSIIVGNMKDFADEYKTQKQKESKSDKS